MAQFDVYPNRDEESKRRFPYLLDVQDDMLDILSTRVVIPLMPVNSEAMSMEKLNPVLSIDGQQYLASVPELAGVRKSILAQPVANLSENRDEIIAALDVLFTGV